MALIRSLAAMVIARDVLRTSKSSQEFPKKKQSKETKKSKKLPALDKYVIFSFSCLIIFTITMIIVQTVTGTTQDTLVTCFFSAFGGELLLCAMIKRLKLKGV
jgi:hypothetical protein